MNKNINNVVELTEKEHECVTGGGIRVRVWPCVGAKSDAVRKRKRPSVNT